MAFQDQDEFSPAAAAAPEAQQGSRLLHLMEISPAEIKERRFGGGFLDRSDPLEGAGTYLSGYSFAGTFPIEREKHATIIHQLFGNVYGHVRGDRIPGAQVQVVDFNDAATGTGESARRYVLIDQETRRGTHMSTFATFCSYGNYLYVSVASYMLPPLALGRVLWGLFLIFLALWSAKAFLGGVFTFLVWMVVLGVVARKNFDVIRSLRAGDDLFMALRREYHSIDDIGTFNADDVRMHFKSSTLMVTEAMQGVFEKNDIPLDLLNRVRESINMYNDLSTHVNASGGILNVLGSVIGGSGNRAG